jgi:hypothetical protein
MPLTFDVQCVGRNLVELRLGDLVIAAKTTRGGRTWEVVLTRADVLLHTDNVRLSESSERRRFRRAAKKKGAEIPVQALVALAAAPLLPGPPRQPGDVYLVRPEGFVYRRLIGGRIESVPLSNFTASIVKQLILDDGSNDPRREYELKVSLASDIKTIVVPAEQFNSPTWIPTLLGANAIVNPGGGGADHFRAAIQYHSLGAPEEHVYAHTGWRVDAGRPQYLHAGGAIDASGLRTDVRVKLPAALARFGLPEAPVSDEVGAAVRATLRFLELGPDHLTVPMLGATFRAVLGPADFSLHVSGQTGVFKTEFAALAQRHFGPELDARHLPASFVSTMNFVGELLFAAKDTLIVVDDFAPVGSPADVQRAHRDADRLLRNQGNAAGRGRLRPDGTMREPRAPRGLIVSTGEDVPLGQSLRARLLVVEVAAGDIDIERLTACQRDAADGLYSQTMSAFLKWLAGNYEIITRLRERVGSLRSGPLAITNTHSRTPGVIADLAAGLEVFFTFATAVGVLTREEAARLMSDRARSALLDAAARQRTHQGADDPVSRFFELLRAALVSGKAHVAAKTTGCPSDPGSLGWQFVGGDWRPQGIRVGWIDGEDLYLQPDVAYRAAQEMAAHGQHLTVTPGVLRRRMHERGVLASVDDSRETLTIRLQIERSRFEVLHLKTKSLIEPAYPSSQPAVVCPFPPVAQKR